MSRWPLCHIESRTVKAGSCQKDHPGHCYSNFSFSRNSFFFRWALSGGVYKAFFVWLKLGPHLLVETSLTNLGFLRTQFESHSSNAGLSLKEAKWVAQGYLPWCQDLVLLCFCLQIQFLLFPFSLHTSWAPVLVPNVIPHLYFLLLPSLGL